MDRAIEGEDGASNGRDRPASIAAGGAVGSAAPVAAAGPRFELAPRYRGLGMVAAHAAIFALIYPLSFLIRFDGDIPPAYLALAWETAPLIVAIKLAIFVTMGCHRGWWRSIGFADLTALAEASLAGTLGLLLLGQFGGFEPALPRSVPILDGAATLLVVGGIRGATRLLRERYVPILRGRGADRVLVVGADDAGLMLVQQVQRQPALRMRVVGILDDAPEARGRALGGVRVLGPTRDLGRLAAVHRAKVVLIPTPATPAGLIGRIVEESERAGVRVLVVPGFEALVSGQLVALPRDVEFQDLLERDPVQLDNDSIARLVRGRVVLITGAAGSIGSELCRQVQAFEPERLVLLDFSENGLFFLERELRDRGGATKIEVQLASIAERSRIRAAFERTRPAVVLHAAAHKHVPMLEANPGEAVKNNVVGTRIAVEEAIRAGAEAFVLISTDKAVNPTSVMGACKRLGEMYVRALSPESPTRLMSVRFGNVLGSNGSVVPIFQKQIRRGGPITVTHPEMTRYFMTIPEAAQLVLQAAAIGVGGEIFVLDMGQPIRILDLVRSMARLSGLVLGRDIQVVFTGLRPGEKLYEELCGSSEQVTPTSHPKVSAVRQATVPLPALRAKLDHLARLADRPGEEIIEALARLVPEYRPSDDLLRPRATLAAAEPSLLSPPLVELASEGPASKAP